MEDKKEISQEQKVWGAISYLWVLSVVALAARKKDDFIRFHANQGALLFAISIPMFFIPGLGWMINCIIGILAIVSIIKALQGEKWELPIIGGLAQKFSDWLIKTIKL